MVTVQLRKVIGINRGFALHSCRPRQIVIGSSGLWRARPGSVL